MFRSPQGKTIVKFNFVALSISLCFTMAAAHAFDTLTPAQQEEVKIKSGKWMEQEQQAEQLNKKHKFAAAEALYKSILAERKSFGLDLSAQQNTLAWFYANWGKNELAEEQFNDQLASVEKNAGLNEMMYCYPLEEHAKFLDKIGKQDEAKKLRARVKSITAAANAPVKLPALPKDMTAAQKLEEAKKCCDMGGKLLDSELQDRAVPYLNRAIALNPNDPTAYLYRSRTSSWINNFAKALQDLNLAIKLKADYSDAYADRGNAYVALKQYPKAYADFEKAFILNPKDTNAMGQKAKLEDENGKHKEAVADYSRIIAIEPGLSWPHVQRGIAYESLKDFPKATADYTILCEKYPKNYEYFELRGNAYLKANQLDKSLADYNKVLSLNSKYTIGYADRAKVYRKMDGKQSPRVMADLKKSK
jgi:tetratricopeptide (TPR) repeat protein